MRRCLVCTLRDDPARPMRPIHQAGRMARAEQGHHPHAYDPGERRIQDRGRAARRTDEAPRNRAPLTEEGTP